MTFRIVDQVGDLTFQLNDHEYDCLPDAMIGPVELDNRYSGEEREFFVDGPGLDHPISVGRQRPSAD